MSTTDKDVIAQLKEIIDKQQARIEKDQVLVGQFDKFIVDMRRLRFDLQRKEIENVRLYMRFFNHERRLTEEIRFLARENKKLRDKLSAKDKELVNLSIIVTPPIPVTPSFSNIRQMERRYSDSMVTCNPSKDGLKIE